MVLTAKTLGLSAAIVTAFRVVRTAAVNGLAELFWRGARPVLTRFAAAPMRSCPAPAER